MHLAFFFPAAQEFICDIIWWIRKEYLPLQEINFRIWEKQIFSLSNRKKITS